MDFTLPAQPLEDEIAKACDNVERPSVKLAPPGATS